MAGYALNAMRRLGIMIKFPIPHARSWARKSFDRFVIYSESWILCEGCEL